MNTQPDNLIVNAGCLLFFNNATQAQDVLDSTLYMQLAASKQYSRFTDYAAWKQTWLAAALHLGWSSKASQNYRQPVPCEQASSFWDWARALCPAFVSAALLERGEAALKSCPLQQSALSIFAGQILAPAATSLSMQVGLVDTDKSLILLQLHFDSSSSLPRDSLFGPWDGERVKGNIEMSFHHLLLSSDPFYAQRRGAMFARLKERRAELVAPVQRLQAQA